MKKYFQSNKEGGFYLIYTIWISLFVFTALSTSVILYQHHLVEVHTLMELTKKETLVQMTKESFKQDGLHNSTEDGHVMYSFPDGDVELQYEKRLDGHWRLTMAITTKKKSSFTAYYLFSMSP